MADSVTPSSFDFTAVLEPQAEGGFSVTVPALPEVITEGETEAEAPEMAAEAIRLLLDYRRDHGLPIPADTTPMVRKITIVA